MCAVRTGSCTLQQLWWPFVQDTFSAFVFIAFNPLSAFRVAFSLLCVKKNVFWILFLLVWLCPFIFPCLAFFPNLMVPKASSKVKVVAVLHLPKRGPKNGTRFWSLWKVCQH